MKTLKQLIDSKKFDWVNSDIEKNFKLEKVRNLEYKLFHFDKYISSENTIKEMEKDGYIPANLTELLSWKDWNGKDFVVALGSVAGVGGDRRVACLRRDDSGRRLDLGWFDAGWGGSVRFLAVRNLDSQTLESSPQSLRTLPLRKETSRQALTRIADALEIIAQKS